MANDVRATLQNLIQEISGINKTAGHKKVAEPITEPGSLEGGTSHPSGKVDDGTQAATTGSFAAEQTAAVKENVGPASVDSAPEATPGSVNQDDHQLNIGTTQSLIGEDPATEDNYKTTKDEPGNIDGKSTTSPATVGDEKFASFTLQEKHAFLTKEANSLLRDLTLAGVAPTPAAATPAAPTSPEAQAVAAGYKTAATAGAPEVQITDADIQGFLRDTVKEAEAIADCAIAYYSQIFKAANEVPPEEATETEDHDKPGDGGSNSGGTPDAGGGAPAAPGGDDMALLAAMSGEGGGGGGAPAAPPAGDMGGLPGTDPALGGSSPVNELFNALVEMGITPDDLHQIADQMASGAGGAPGGAPGMPPGGAPGMPPDAAGGPSPADMPKIAAARQAARNVKLACRNGHTRICETKTAQQRELRQRYKQALYDFVAR